MFENKPSNSDFAPELPVLPLRNMLLMPGVTMPFEVGRRSSLKLLEMVVKQHPPTLLVAVPVSRAFVSQLRENTGLVVHPFFIGAEGADVRFKSGGFGSGYASIGEPGAIRPDPEGDWARISLGVHSSLEAVGLTAALSDALAEAELVAVAVENGGACDD